MKNETIEEAGERAVKSGLFKDETLFIAGAKWQQERSYSKEEVLSLLMDFRDNIPNDVYVVDWFEKFKKK